MKSSRNESETLALRFKRRLPFFAIICVLTTTLSLLPAPQTEQLKMWGMELTLPASQKVATWFAPVSGPSPQLAAEDQASANSNATPNPDLLRLQLLAGQLQQRLKESESSHIAGLSRLHSQPAKWLQSSLLSARLITQDWKPALETMLSQTENSGQVLDHPSHWIDQGRMSGLKGQELVLHGDVIIGKVARVGQRLSQLQPVNEAEFRLPVQILHQHSENLHFSPEASLHGSETGQVFLEYVPAETPVSTGDLVVSTLLAPGSTRRALVGTIEQAQLNSETGFWEIVVTPAFQPTNGNAVSVLLMQGEKSVVTAQTQSGAPPLGRSGGFHD